MGNNIVNNKVHNVGLDNNKDNKKTYSVDELLFNENENLDKKDDVLNIYNKTNILVIYGDNRGILNEEGYIKYKNKWFVSVTSFIKEIIKRDVTESDRNTVIFKYKDIELDWSSEQIQSIRKKKGKMLAEIYSHMIEKYGDDYSFHPYNHNDVIVKYFNNIGILDERGHIKHRSKVFASVTGFIKEIIKRDVTGSDRSMVIFRYKNTTLNWNSEQIQKIYSEKKIFYQKSTTTLLVI